MSATNTQNVSEIVVAKAEREVPTTYGKLNAAEKKYFCFTVHALRYLKGEGVISSDIDEFDINIDLIYYFNNNKNIFKEIDLEVKADLKEKKKNEAIRKKLEKDEEKKAKKEAKKNGEKKNDKKKVEEVEQAETGPNGTVRTAQPTKPGKKSNKKEAIAPAPVAEASEYKATVTVKMNVEFKDSNLPKDKCIELIKSELQIDPYADNDMHEFAIKNVMDDIYEITYKVKNLEEKDAIFEAEFMTDIDPDNNCPEISMSYRTEDIKYEPIVANQTEELIKAGMKKPRISKKKQQEVVVSEVAEPEVAPVEQEIVATTTTTEPEVAAAEPATEQLVVTEELKEEQMIEEVPKKNAKNAKNAKKTTQKKENAKETKDKVADAITDALQDEDVAPANVTVRRKYTRKPKTDAEKNEA